MKITPKFNNYTFISKTKKQMTLYSTVISESCRTPIYADATPHVRLKTLDDAWISHHGQAGRNTVS